MHALRRWSVRRAGLMEAAYRVLDRVLDAVRPVVRFVGYDRLERPVAFVERHALCAERRAWLVAPHV